MENKKKGQYYNTGDMLWRHDDNALFQITAIVSDEPTTPAQNKAYYKLHCVNGVTEDDEIAYCDLVATGKTALSPIAPSKLVRGQHIWDKENYNEFIVKRIIEPDPPTTAIPCDSCHNGMCEQCIYGYKSKAQILSMLKSKGTKETAYELLSSGGTRLIQVNKSLFEKKYTMYPPMYVEDKSLLIVETDKTGKEIKSAKKVELDLPDKEEDKEVLDMTKSYGGYQEALIKAIEDTEKDSYQKWKDSLHVVQVPAFDLNYFKVGDAYLIQEHAYVGFKHNAILITAEKDKLVFLNASEKAWTSPVSEYKEISLKDYLNGKYGIKKLVVEEKENA